ncbi:MAG: hypothetical protein P8Z75_15075 [Gammaproteobacteria bacterium]|jgi:hypothetical protein
MKCSYSIYMLAMTLTSNVYAGTFDIKIGKISLPDEFLARPGTPAVVHGSTVYSFINNKNVRLSTTALGVMIFNYKKQSPEIGDESDKSAATSCLQDTITAMNKSFPAKAVQPYSKSSIGNHFAMEAVVDSKLGKKKMFIDIRCMKYKDFLVTVTVTEFNKNTYLGLLGKKVTEIKLHR